MNDQLDPLERVENLGILKRTVEKLNGEKGVKSPFSTISVAINCICKLLLNINSRLENIEKKL